MTQAIKIERARSGEPVPVVNGQSLHSRYDPAGEGEKLADRFLSEGERPQRILVFGLGFGYHITPLLQRGIDCLIYEPDAGFLDTARRHGQIDEILQRCTVLTSLAQLPPDAPIRVFALPQVRRRFQAEFEELNQMLRHLANGGMPGGMFDPADLRIMLVYPVYGGSYTTACYTGTALKKAGFTVLEVDNARGNDILQDILALDDKNHGALLTEKLTELLADLTWESFVRFQPHLVLFMAQAPVTEHLIKTIREHTSAVTAFWFVEDFRRFPYWKLFAPMMDVFLVIQKEPFFSHLRSRNVPRALYLPMAAEDAPPPRLTASDRQTYGSDVSFMGAGYPNRRRLFSQLRGFDLKIWGTEWGEGLAHLVQNEGQWVTPEQTRKIYAASRININLHSSTGNELFDPEGDFVNPRTFEIPAAGGFQLVDRRPLLGELFTEDEEIVCFSSLEELRDKIDYYLKHEDQRQKIARNGQRRTLNHHTYVHRMQAMIEYIRNHIPTLSRTVNSEKSHRQDILDRIADSSLNEFLESIPAADRNRLPVLAEHARKRTSPFLPYQAMILALESFYNNE